jgi:uncharacterized protein YndB with AHSA1/START domain
MTVGAPSIEREVTITRLLAAPRELVFRAWTDPAHLARWWGPKGFTNPVCEVDARVGGALRIVMRAPDGAEYPMKGEFREVVAPTRLVFTNIAIDTDGSHMLEGLTTVTFALQAPQGDKTLMTLHTRAVGVVALSAQMLDGMEEGWTESIDKLEAYVGAA